MGFTAFLISPVGGSYFYKNKEVVEKTVLEMSNLINRCIFLVVASWLW